ncbi:MAG: ABC transporter ATP-binding protein [Rhizobiaceae bacterium]
MANIELTDVLKTFGSFTAVDRISAHIEDGEFVTLLGPSGCGKTTLLNLISGFLMPDGGAISIDGKDVSSTPPEHRDTAMCFQSYALFPHLSVRENLAFGLRQLKWNNAKIKARIDELAGQLDLTANLDKLPNQLSGGQQQRVALGRALAIRPGVVLFDEPLSNLDAKLRESVRFEIRKIQKESGLTAIYVTHDQSEALAMSDRIFVLNAGHVEQSGTPLEIYNTPATRFVADFIGAANIVEGDLAGKSSDRHFLFSTPLGELKVAAGSKPEAQRHFLCWRPEDALVGNDVDGWDVNTFEGTLVETAYQGGFTDIFVAINGVRQRVQAAGAYIPKSDKVHIHVPANKLRLLEPIT